MDIVARRITSFLVKENIVHPEQEAWVRYGISKRLSTLIAAVPLLIISTILTSFDVSAFYFLSFAIIRRRANGYHAHTWLRCLFMSCAIVSIFLGLLYPLITPIVSVGAIAICIILVFVLAPYDHELMHLTPEEYTACKHRSRIAICITASAALVLYVVRLDKIAAAIISGMVTATFLLCLGHITDWRKQHEKQAC